MPSSIEEKVEEYYKNLLDKLNIKYYGKTQSLNMNKSISKALDKAPSKSGGEGKNYPDIMFMLYCKKLNKHIPVMVEAKGKKGKLEKKNKEGNLIYTVPYKQDSKPNAKIQYKKGDNNWNAVVDYAVNGAYHYAKAVLDDYECNFDEVLFIGINGYELDKNNKVKNPEHKAYYISRENKKVPIHINDLDNSLELLKERNLEKLFQIISKLGLSEEELEKLTLKTEEELERAVKQIHQDIYDNDSIKNALTTNEKLYLFCGLIMAGLQVEGVTKLKPEDLKGNQKTKDNDGTIIISKIGTFLDAHYESNEKNKMILDLLSPVFSKKKLWSVSRGESVIKYIFTHIFNNILPLLESDLLLDFTGKILNSLNDWVAIDNDKKNDVVLTPRYITNLMVKLCRTDHDSFVWDTAMGSGGFLVSAMNEMIKSAKNKFKDVDKLNKKIESIKSKQLLGIELLGNIYILAVLNMILMGDGSTNMKNDDSHKIYDIVDFPANVFLLNPPYSAPGKGFNFVEEAFSKMKKGYGAVLIQENAGSGNGLPYTKNILKNNKLIASIKMPNDLFNGKSSVQTAIYVFEINVPHDLKNSVKFIDFSEDGYTRQNRRKSSQAVNLRDTDNAKERYQELIDIVLDKIPDTHYYTKENNKFIEDKISLEGNDWTFNQHLVIDITPKQEDFTKVVSNYLAWEISQLLKES